MEAEISPEPTPDELKALDEALTRLLSEPVEPRSSWWREGLREALSDPSEG